MKGYGFVIIELVIVIALLAVLAAAAVAAVDPLQRARQDQDSKTRDKAANLIDAVDRFAQKHGHYPWGEQVLAWTRGNDQRIHLESLISEGFLSTEQGTEMLLVGRGGKDTDKLYACYAPTAQANRIDIVKLYSLKVGEGMPGDGQPGECLTTPDWQTTYCYLCLAK